jgi:hypothetical protein
VTKTKTNSKKISAVKRIGRKLTRSLSRVAHTKKESSPMANRFVSFLENFGLAVLRGAQIIPQVTTALESSAGQAIPVLDKLSQIWSLVKLAEGMISKVMGPGSGPQKASAIGPYVAQIVMSSEIVAGKQIAPEKLAIFNQKCQELGGLIADIGNCLVGGVAGISTEDANPTPFPTAVISPAKAAPAFVPAKTIPEAIGKLTDLIESQIPETPGVAAAIAAGTVQGLPQE